MKQNGFQKPILSLFSPQDFFSSQDVLIRSENKQASIVGQEHGYNNPEQFSLFATTVGRLKNLVYDKRTRPCARNEWLYEFLALYVPYVHPAWLYAVLCWLREYMLL